MRCDDRVDVERAVQVRKELFFAMRTRFVAKLRNQRVAANLEKDQIISTAVQQVRRPKYLLNSGEVNEPFRLEVLRNIGARMRGLSPTARRHDVKHDFVHQLDLIGR